MRDRVWIEGEGGGRVQGERVVDRVRAAWGTGVGGGGGVVPL